MAYACKVLADSISPAGHRLTSFEVTFPRIVLAEVNTHKMLSKSSASSRAIPVKDRIAALLADPFVPESFGRNQRGMQPGRALEGPEDRLARDFWETHLSASIDCAGGLAGLEVHKQLANRLLEAHCWHTAIITGTDWDNFFHLRVNPLAQGEFQSLAKLMQDAMAASESRALGPGEWHLPYVDGGESFNVEVDGHGDSLRKISAARCARLSYLTQKGVRDPREDLSLFGRLLSAGHMAPLEHPARPMEDWELEAYEQWLCEVWVDGHGSRTMRVSREFKESLESYEQPGKLRLKSAKQVHYSGNLNGWISCRALVPGEHDILGHRAQEPGV
jgi:hypothetical protein